MVLHPKWFTVWRTFRRDPISQLLPGRPGAAALMAQACSAIIPFLVHLVQQKPELGPLTLQGKKPPAKRQGLSFRAPFNTFPEASL